MVQISGCNLETNHGYHLWLVAWNWSQTMIRNQQKRLDRTPPRPTLLMPHYIWSGNEAKLPRVVNILDHE